MQPIFAGSAELVDFSTNPHIPEHSPSLQWAMSLVEFQLLLLQKLGAVSIPLRILSGLTSAAQSLTIEDHKLKMQSFLP